MNHREKCTGASRGSLSGEPGTLKGWVYSRGVQDGVVAGPEIGLDGVEDYGPWKPSDVAR